MDTQQFSTKNDFEFAIRLESGPSRVVVRFPTDEEWSRHAATCKTFFKNLGRGKSQTEIDNGKADQALYSAVRLESSPDLDPVEAGRIVELLGAFDIRDCRSEGDAFVVEAAIHSQLVEIRLKAPTTKAVLEYRKRALQLISLPHGRTQMITRLTESGMLFDSCFVSLHGYEAPVSLLHKDRVLRAVIEFIETEVDGDENF